MVQVREKCAVQPSLPVVASPSPPGGQRLPQLLARTRFLWCAVTLLPPVSWPLVGCRGAGDTGPPLRGAPGLPR